MLEKISTCVRSWVVLPTFVVSVLFISAVTVFGILIIDMAMLSRLAIFGLFHIVNIFAGALVLLRKVEPVKISIKQPNVEQIVNI